MEMSSDCVENAARAAAAGRRMHRNGTRVARADATLGRPRVATTRSLHATSIAPSTVSPS